MKSFVPFEPCFHLRVFVCGVVIHYQMQFKIIGCSSVDLLEKLNLHDFFFNMFAPLAGTASPREILFDSFKAKLKKSVVANGKQCAVLLPSILRSHYSAFLRMHAA
jgi:hypothetical protein